MKKGIIIGALYLIIVLTLLTTVGAEDKDSLPDTDLEEQAWSHIRAAEELFSIVYKTAIVHITIELREP